MKVTSVRVFPLNDQTKTIKANGTVEIDGLLDLNFVVLNSGKGPFISWKGTETYKDKEGKTKYASPIFIKDKTLNGEIETEIINKFNSIGKAPRTNPSMTVGDDLPF